MTLTEPHDLTLESARLVSIGHGPGNLVGNWVGRRPRFDPTTARLMAASVPADGGSIGKNGVVNLVLLLRTETGGQSGPARVTYTDGHGDTHTWVGGSAMRIEPGKAC